MTIAILIVGILCAVNAEAQAVEEPRYTGSWGFYSADGEAISVRSQVLASGRMAQRPVASSTRAGIDQPYVREWANMRSLPVWSYSVDDKGNRLDEPLLFVRPANGGALVGPCSTTGGTIPDGLVVVGSAESLDNPAFYTFDSATPAGADPLKPLADSRFQLPARYRELVDSGPGDGFYVGVATVIGFLAISMAWYAWRSVSRRMRAKGEHLAL